MKPIFIGVELLVEHRRASEVQAQFSIGCACMRGVGGPPKRQAAKKESGEFRNWSRIRCQTTLSNAALRQIVALSLSFSEAPVSTSNKGNAFAFYALKQGTT